MAVNGFVIFLVCSKRYLRTKTNAFVVSLAVADFGVGMIIVPSRFFCSLATECTPRSKEGLMVMFVRTFIIYTSGTNLVGLVLERYVAVVKPLKYLTFMKRRRVIQMVLTSWGIPSLFTLTLAWITLSGIDRARTMRSYLYLIFEVILCVILIFFLASMFFAVYSRDRTLAKKLRLSQPIARAKTQNKASAVKWVALVTCVFLSCYGIMMRCSLLFLTGQSCNDYHYKIPLEVINSGINPIAYAFFKRDIQQECKRLLFERRQLINDRIVPTQVKHC
ncbi:trace amine-associated receptor 1-like [Pocillopora verrucosa]|uniref:trace amine-associated receptor 1-like n=1 Tax=Pocillopora verrucosa TaxID=203993 RepID=UPI00333EA3BE